ncbi:MAG: rhodanese-like domain-containing protein [Anaerolineae bacterium]|nr:rhodanese-like domain-containing protein [Anaerolineae bacterium]MCO5192100.1 rhodanese-like domain-containing protein [Anaerolineae bacterium]MCO5204327.1 rhodanese-like domain-containing protein [Anaerolineae bacterium]
MFESLLSRLRGSANTVEKIDVAELRQRLTDDKSLILLDVREPQEFAGGHVARARLLPLSQIRDRLGEIPQDKPIALICRSGNRSGSAARILAKSGYEQVANVRGGMGAWSRAGYPVSTGKSSRSSSSRKRRRG